MSDENPRTGDPSGAPTGTSLKPSLWMILVILASMFRPASALAQNPASPTSAASRAHDGRESIHRRTGQGLAIGVTASALLGSALFNGSVCTGSGDYLSICRTGFGLGVAAGAGAGALIGYLVKSTEPVGRSYPILGGAALGSVGAFLLSLPLCSNDYDGPNPPLCTPEGMPTVLSTALFAASGAVIGFLISGESAGSGLDLSVAPGADGSAMVAGRFLFR